jgi:WD40 repeat protein
VATVGYDGTLAVWDVVAGVCKMRTSAHQKPVVSCVFSSDGHEIITASLDGMIRIWDIVSGGMIASIDAHEGGALAIAAIGEGLVVSAGVDKALRVWNTETTLMVHEHGLPVSPKSLTAHNGLVAMGDSLGNVWRFRWNPAEYEMETPLGDGMTSKVRGRTTLERGIEVTI